MKAPRNRPARICAAALLTAAIITLAPVEADGGAKSYFGWVTNFKDGTVSVIDLDTYTVVATYPVGKKPLGIKGAGDSLAVVAVQNANQVAVIDARGGVQEVFDVGRKPQDVALPSSAEFAYVSCLRDNMIQVVTEAGAGATTEVGKRPGSMAYSPNGKWVAVLNKGDGTLDIFKAKNLPRSRQARVTLAIGTSPATVAFHRKSKEIAVTSPKDGTVTIVNVKKGTIEQVLDVPDSPWGGTYSPTRNNMAAITRTGANVARIFSKETTVDIEVGRKPKGIVFTPDGKRILVANSRSASVSVIDVATATVVATIKVGKVPVAVAVTSSDVREEDRE